MRLAFVSPCFHDKHYGGIQLTARLALQGLRGSSLGNTDILCYGPKCSEAAGSAGGFCSHSKAEAAVRALRFRGRSDYLLFWHLHVLSLMPLIGTRGKRTYLFLHGIEAWCSVSGMMRRFLDQIDVFLTNSDFTWQRFVEMHPQWARAEHRTVHLGVGEPETRIDRPGDVPAAVIVARMMRAEGYKGHVELVKAWPVVLERVPNAELWVVGGGDAGDDLRDLAFATGVGGKVRFFGVVSDEEKQRLLQRSRCLVLPSRGEGFGLVYLEAMRLGRPCLASIYDAGQEVISPPQAGISVDPSDTEGLAEAVTQLLTPGAAWQQQSENARRRYEESFTAAHFQRRLLDALAN